MSNTNGIREHARTAKRGHSTAKATALSNPWPELGSLTFHGALSDPPNHGGYAGLSVPTVREPSLTRFRSDLSQDAAEVVPPADSSLLDPPHPAAVSARTRNSAASLLTPATLT